MSKFRAHLFKNCVLIGGCLMAGNLWASEPASTSPAVGLPLPGISAWGMGGNSWTAIGDAMAPLFGQYTRFFYLDPQFYYHSNENGYTGSLGAGTRRLTNAGILGAYVFGDYNRSTTGQNFWFVSPGVERLGKTFDFSANGYIPVSSQRINTGVEFADQAGDTSQVVFAGHTQYDALVNTFTSTGYGADAQVGVRLPILNSEIYLGGYYFAPKDTNTVGGGAMRLQVPINRYVDILFSEAYDNEYHNTVKAGFTVWLGGRHTTDGFSGDLTERMVDPIQRDLVIVAGGSHTGQPAVSSFTDTGQTAIELQNISFFLPNATPGATPSVGNGTYENPYIGMTQANVNDANAQNNRNFYINSGTYGAVYGTNDPNYIVLNNDQLYGRQNDFTKAAEGAARPLIEFISGGFEVPAADSYDTFTGLQLAGAYIDGHAGIWVDHTDSPSAQTVNINNTSAQGFGDGIDILNNSNSTLTVNLYQSLISGNNGHGELYAPYQTFGGIAAVNAEDGALQFNMQRSTVSGNIKTADDFFVDAVGGLALSNPGNGTMTVNLNHSTFSNNGIFIANANGNDSEHIEAAGGVAAANDGAGAMTIDADHSTFSYNTVSAFTENQGPTESTQAAGGLAVVNENAGTLLVDVNHSTFSNNLFLVDNENNASAIQYDALGGFAAANEGAGTMGLNVTHSSLNNNTFMIGFGDDGRNQAVAMGGLAVINNFDPGPGTVTLNVNRSDFSGNQFNIGGNTSFFSTAIGGLAAVNGFEESAMTVNIYRSLFSKNVMFFGQNGGSGFGFNEEQLETIGGLALDNRGHDSTLIASVLDSKILDNRITLNDDAGSGFMMNNIYAMGGMAVMSHDGWTTVDVSHSTISGNTVSISDNNSFDSISTIGGLAVYASMNQSDGFMIFDISHSTISQNTIASQSTAEVETIDSAGGLAVFNATNGMLSLHVDHATISGNTQSFDDQDSFGETIRSVGGLSVANYFSTIQPMQFTVSHTTISDNSATFSGGSPIADAVGGLALATQNSLPMTVQVDNSVITANSPGGIDIFGDNSVAMNLDHSTVSGNSDFALTANGGATVNVTNPVFFDGIVNALAGSTVYFPGLQPITTSDVHVVCSPDGTCTSS